MNNQSTITLFNDGGNPYRGLLETFLKLPIGSTDEVFALFASLPGAVFCQGEGPMERFVYVPGSREDRILLTAHADTCWDERYGVKPVENVDPVYAMGFYYGANYARGLGADSRAGCAMLWALRESGHSLLVTDGEVHGKIGALYLRHQQEQLFKEINRTHRMILTLDAPGGNNYVMHQVKYTDRFLRYLAKELELSRGTMRSESDLDVLCKELCGASLGVGYLNPYRTTELFTVGGWNDLYGKLSEFLQKEHPRFTTSRAAHRMRSIKKVLYRPVMIIRKPFSLCARVFRKLKRDGFKATAAAVWRRIKR